MLARMVIIAPRILSAFLSLVLAGILLTGLIVGIILHPHQLRWVELWLAVFCATYLITAAGLVAGKVWAHWLCLVTTMVLVCILFLLRVWLMFFSAWATPDRVFVGFLLAAIILSVILLVLLMLALIMRQIACKQHIRAR